MKRFSNIKIARGTCRPDSDLLCRHPDSWAEESPYTRYNLSEYLTLIDDGQVSTAVISDRIQELSGVLSDGTQYRLKFPREFTDELTVELTQAFTAD